MNSLERRLPTPDLHYIPLLLLHNTKVYLIRLTIDLPTVQVLKLQIQSRFGLPLHSFQILYQDEVLEEDNNINYYNIDNYDNISLAIEPGLYVPFQPNVINNNVLILINNKSSNHHLDMAIDHKGLKYYIREVLQLPISSFQFTVNGKTCLAGPLRDNYNMSQHLTVIVTFKLLGGGKKKTKNSGKSNKNSKSNKFNK